MERIKHLKGIPSNNQHHSFNNSGGSSGGGSGGNINNTSSGGHHTLVSRNRSQSIDMIVMDEVSKHGTLTTWNSIVNLENNNNTELHNNFNNNSHHPININNNNYLNISNNNNNFNINKNRSNSTSNLNISNSNNNNNTKINHNNSNSSNSLNNTIHINNNNQHNFTLNFASLNSLGATGNNSATSSPPVSPRGNLNLMNTAPNLSSFIAQHTPPPSPRLDGTLNMNLHLQPPPPNDRLSKNLSAALNNLDHSPSSSLNNSSSGIYRNLSFSQQKISSVQSLDLTLAKSHSNSGGGGGSGNDGANSHDIEMKQVQQPPHTPHTPHSGRKKKRESKSIRRMKRFIQGIVGSRIWASVMLLFILYILFIDDAIGIAGSPSSYVQNYIVVALKLLCILFFSIDIIGNSIGFADQYIPKTIIFWLDLISVLSIIPDIYQFFSGTILSHNYLVLSIGKSARIIRICGCFLSLSFISYFYKKFFSRKSTTSNGNSNGNDELEVEASKLGEKLIRLTTNKLVLLVLLVYFAGQILTYPSELPEIFLKSTINQFEFLYTSSIATNDFFNEYLNNYLNSNSNILSITINSIEFYNNQEKIDSLQLNSIFEYSTSNSNIIINNSDTIFINSLLHLCFTLFTIIVIMIINLFIVIDAYGLVINPLENVLAIVKFLSRQNAVMQKSNLRVQTRDRVESVGNKSEGDTTSSSVDVEDPDDEADYLLGMLNDIDDSLQAAKEKVQNESIQNSILKKDIEDLYVEKYILQVHLRSVIRKSQAIASLDDPIGQYLKKKQLALLSDTLPFADDIRFKGSDMSLVIAGTLDALVDRLTLSENHDLKFTNIFLLTFRKFMSPIELMERLIIRFCVTPTMELPEKQLESSELVDIWRKQKQEQIRVSVFNTLKLWIGKYNWDFHNNSELIELFNNLVQRIMPFCKMDRYASHLDSFLKRKLTNYQLDREFAPLKPLTSEEIAQMMVMEDRVLFNFDIHDVAIQITLLEFDLFRSIKPQEFLDLAWTSKTKSIRSPNICRFIDHFNNVSFWLQTLLVKSGRVKDRVAVLKKIISLGDSFVQLNNFYGAMEVLSSLESSSIARLHKTWEMLPEASSKQLQSLQKLLSPMGSFKEYRERLKLATSACIPYIGVFLSDLTFIHEGNPDLKEGTLINFVKQKDIASIIISIQQYQNTYYYFESNEKIKSQFNLRGIDSDTIWKMSLTAEPRRNQ